MNLFPILAPTSQGHIQDSVEALDLELSQEECDSLLG